MIKSLILSTVLLLSIIPTWACEVCERNQPKILKGITHGAGPEGNWDYVIVGVTMIIVVLTLFYSIKWLIKPGEASQKHIKRFILDNQ